MMLSILDRALLDDGGEAIADYNERLEALGTPKWFDVEWMFAECYLYRLACPFV